MSWRFTLHERAFTATDWRSTIISELHGARGRRVETALNKPTKVTFTLNGTSPAAMMVEELRTDIIAWRTDERTSGLEVPHSRALVGQSEDQLTEQSHTVNFTCLDYSSMLDRRFLTTALAYNNVHQDDIVADLLSHAINLVASDGTHFLPGSWLPLELYHADPDGRARAPGTDPLRIRNYDAQASIGESISQMAAVDQGFDYDVTPGATTDELRVFFPQQGIPRIEPILEYGSTVSTVTRSVASADYTNYWRVIGESTGQDVPRSGPRHTTTPPTTSPTPTPTTSAPGRAPTQLPQLANRPH